VCERYVIPEQSDVEREFRVVQPWWRFAASFNVAPKRPVPVVRLYQGAVEGVMLHWGLIPEWAEGNAQQACAPQVPIERIADDPITRGAWAGQQRCIVPALGFYVWRLTEMRYRQPYFVQPMNRGAFGIAALWDRTACEDDDDVIESCTMVSVTSLSPLSESSRLQVPAILQRDDYDRWLNAPAESAHRLLYDAARQPLFAHAISPRINALTYDDPRLMESVEDRERLSA
jgi:putative SOS response-associated peptidase YedK